MFTPVPFILAFLFSTSILENGIRLTELPGTGDSVQIVIGYESAGLTALQSSLSARSLILAAYSVGGDSQFFTDVDRSALRLTAPPWAKPMFLSYIADFFKETPGTTDERRDPDFRERAEIEIRDALLGPQLQSPDYGTQTAFLSMTRPIPETLKENLAAIPTRTSAARPGSIPPRLTAERTLRFTSDQPVGAVIFASPAPSVHFKGWYQVLMLDRLLRRTLSLKPVTSLPLSLRPYYYRLELSVAQGRFPEEIEEGLLQEISRLSLSRSSTEDLETARRECGEYLETKDVREWFISQGIEERRQEGLQWIKTMSSDDLRAAARDLLVMNHVIATWPPSSQRTTVTIENLDDPKAPDSQLEQTSKENVESIVLPPFPPHADTSQLSALPERLESGIWLIAGSVHAIYVAGDDLNILPGEPDQAVVSSYRRFRSERILVMSPVNALSRVRELWKNFVGNLRDEDRRPPAGSVSSGDLVALLLLKTLLDRKVIEAGWWSDVQLKIDAAIGSELRIVGDDRKRAIVLGWAKGYAAAPPTDVEMTWGREVCLHRFDQALPHLQGLTWHRDVLGALQPLETVTSAHVQDVARIYF